MNGNTPFLRTCMSGQSKAAKFLLQNGAKITDVDKNSHGALHVIVRNDPSLRTLIKTAEHNENLTKGRWKKPQKCITHKEKYFLRCLM